MGSRRFLIVSSLAIACAVVGACSVGGFEKGGDAGPDAGDGATADAVGGDTGTEPETDVEEADGSDGTSASRPPQTFTFCGAGGVSSGSGVQAIQCFGPAEISGREASGGGVRWQPGAFRLVSDRAR